METNQRLQCLEVVIMNDIIRYDKVVSYQDLLDETIPERRFKIIYSIKEFFFLTEDERNFLLSQIGSGAKFVQIGEHTFTDKFSMLYPIRDKEIPKGSDYEIIDGKAVKK